MVKELLLKDKKGVSLMVGYVLLIVVGISLSILVYSYLKFYLPKDQAKCQDDVHLVIDKLECIDNKITISLTNKGLFTVDRVQIRVGEQGRVYKELINKPDAYVFIAGATSPGYLTGLPPAASWEHSYDYVDKGVKEIEIEPLQYIDNKPTLCEKAVVAQSVVCS